jgi:hypothetical protein
MLHSCEMRWFFLGAAPEQAKIWFGTADAQKEGSRRDSYLIFPGCAVIGFKLRNGGKLEIKALHSPPSTIEPVKGIIGKVDRWVRWSPEFELTGGLKHAIRHGSRWVDIDKTRWLRTYEFHDGSPREVGGKERPSEGCNVELTELRLENGVWWTVGFEAFGPSTKLEDHLRATLEEFFSSRREEALKSLSEANSMSYPAWFAGVGLA